VELRWLVLALILEVTSLPSSQIPKYIINSYYLLNYFFNYLRPIYSSYFLEDLLLESLFKLANERLILSLDTRL
jgi:hypothetical protein